MTEQTVIWWRRQGRAAWQLSVWVFAVLYGVNAVGALQLSFLGPPLLLPIGLAMLGVAFAIGSLAKKEKWKPAFLLIALAILAPGVAVYIVKDQPLLARPNHGPGGSAGD